MRLVTVIPLRLLQLPAIVRLGVVVSSLIICLGIYGLAFPTAILGGVLVLPVALASWLFRWRGGFLCVVSIALLLLVSHILVQVYANTPGSINWLVPLAVGSFSGLLTALIVGSLRHLIDTLIATQQHAEEAQQAYQQEQLVSQVREQALQNLSHELRTPLTQIQGYLELLKECRDQCDATMQAYFIDQASDGCDELLSLINTVLETARLSNNHRPQLQSFSLLHEVEAVVAHFDPRFLHTYDLSIDIPKSLTVQADPRFVRQVIRNLLSNAFKYTPPQTRIAVRAFPYANASESQEDGQRICVQVEDQGVGIAPEQLQFVFQRFTRLEHARKQNQPGTGLGLAICRQLVESMGGRIWVVSTGQPGKGCCFSFTLVGAPALHNSEPAEPEHLRENDHERIGANRRVGVTENVLLPPDDAYQFLAQMAGKLPI